MQYFYDLNVAVDTYLSYCLQTQRHNVIHNNLNLKSGFFCNCQNLSHGQNLGCKMAVTIEKIHTWITLARLISIPKAEFKFNELFFSKLC